MLSTLLQELRSQAITYQEAQKRKDPELEYEIAYVTACIDHDIAKLHVISKIIERRI